MSAAKKTPVKTKNPSFLSLLKDDRVKRIVGLLLLLFAFLMLVSFASALFKGAADQAVITETIVDDFNQETKVEEANNALGIFGVWIAKVFMHNMFGLASFLLVYFLLALGLNLMLDKAIFNLKRIVIQSTFLIFFIAAFLEFLRSLFFNESFYHPGGFIGYSIAGTNGWMPNYIKGIGTGAVLLVIGLIYAIWNFNLRFDFLNISLWNKKNIQDFMTEDAAEREVPISMDETIFEKDKLEKEESVNINPLIINNDEPIDLSLFQINQNKNDETTLELDEEEELTDEELDFKINEDLESDDFEIEYTNEPHTDAEDVELDVVANIPEPIKARGTTENYDPTLDLSNYKFPLLEFLENHGSNDVRIDKEELEENKNQIVQTLLNYKIEISKIKATVGPTVTLYEIIPAAGVRISKIKSLEDDIALSLAALGIRIIAPIPGKGTIGIEVPNIKKEIVSMRSVLASEAFKNSKADLPIGLGKNIANEVVIADLAKMPHMLMAGATGQGKSVGINAVLVSLLYKMHPSQLKFVLVDPKKVELSIYSLIEKHFLAKLPGEEESIITDVSKVVATLNSLCIEMDDRYNLLKLAKARNLKEYNKKFINRELNPLNGHKFMPFIVLIVDEFADLIMTAGKEVETPIARLAQLARAIGIHLILATQRPSVNIITGVIKANFPARVSFKVASKIDSRTILDAGGADQLIGRGDLLFSQGNELIRIQCAFVDTPEVEKIVNFIGEQQGYPTAFELPEYVDPNEEGFERDDMTDPSERDPLFEEAARIIVLNQVGSTSLIQRRLKLGYNRAGRLMDQLEEVGIVGKNAGSKARDVLVKTESDLEQFLSILKENR